MKKLQWLLCSKNFQMYAVHFTLSNVFGDRFKIIKLQICSELAFVPEKRCSGSLWRITRESIFTENEELLLPIINYFQIFKEYLDFIFNAKRKKAVFLFSVVGVKRARYQDIPEAFLGMKFCRKRPGWHYYDNYVWSLLTLQIMQ